MKLDERLIEDHLKNVYGYHVKKEDEYLLKHLIVKVERLIKNFCHVSRIPSGAVHPAVDYICGLFLLEKIQTGTLTDEKGNPMYDFYMPEQSVSIGDVTIANNTEYSSLEGGNGFLNLVSELADKKTFLKALTHFRKIKWKP